MLRNLKWRQWPLFFWVFIQFFGVGSVVLASSNCEQNRKWLAYQDPNPSLEARKDRIRKMERQAGFELNGCMIWWLVTDFKTINFHPLFVAFEKGFREDSARAKELLVYVNKKFNVLFNLAGTKPFYVCDKENRPALIYEQLTKKVQEYPEYGEALMLLVDQMAPSFLGDWGVFVAEDNLREPYYLNPIHFRRNGWVTYEKGPYAGMRGYWRLTKGIPDVWVIEGIGSSGQFEEWEFYYSLNTRQKMMCSSHKVGESSVDCSGLEYETNPQNDLVAPRVSSFAKEIDGRIANAQNFRGVFGDFGPYISDVIASPVEYQDERDLRSVTKCQGDNSEGEKFIYINENSFEWELTYKKVQESRIESGSESESDDPGDSVPIDYSQVEGKCEFELAEALDFSNPLPFEAGLGIVSPAMACGPDGNSGLWYGPSTSLSDLHEGRTHQHFLCCKAEEGSVDAVCQKENYIGVSRCVLSAE